MFEVLESVPIAFSFVWGLGNLERNFTDTPLFLALDGTYCPQEFFIQLSL
jgi:hypothetical protein